MADTVAEIKERLNFLEFMRGYLKLIPAGRNFKALCPFHKEKSPSFSISPDRQMWYCFGCSKGGDVFKFLMEYENIEFFEALKILAEKAGVTVQTSGAHQDAYRELYEINRLAKDFFCDQLHKTQSAYQAAAAKYLAERGLTNETIPEFEIGLASTSGDALFRYLVAQKKSVQSIEKAGLIIRSERGTYWDRFRSRVMFPLYNQFGKIVGFTGRILPIEGVQTENVGKYVNSPETPIFNKSKLLYGLHKAKNNIRDAQTAIVVEGQMDFLMMWQDGIKNVVASSGTALTVEQLGMLRRLAETVILSFDSDTAGQAAAERSIDIAAAQDFNVKILKIGTMKDPADVVKSAPGTMINFVHNAKTSMEFYLERYPVVGIDRAVQKKNIRAILAKIQVIASPIERAAAIGDVSVRTGIAENILNEEMTALPKTNVPGAAAAAVQKIEERADVPRTRKDRIAERIIGLVLRKPELKSIASSASAQLGEHYAILLERIEGGIFVNLPLDIAPIADMLALNSGFLELGKDEDVAKEMQKLISELRLEFLKERREVLRREITTAEREGNESRLQGLLKEFDGVLKALHNIV